MGRTSKVQKKPQHTARVKPRKRQQTPEWDDYHDKHMLLNVFHLLNVGKPNFRHLSEVMGKKNYSEHHLRKRFGKLQTAREEIKKYRERTESLFVSDDDSESEDDFSNGHSEVHVVIGNDVENEQPSPGSDATFDSSRTDSGYGPASSPISDPVTPTPRHRSTVSTRTLPILEAQTLEHERYSTESRLRGDLHRPANHSTWARSPNRSGPPPDAPRQPAAHRSRQRSRRRPESSRNSGHNVNITSSLNVNTTRRDDRRNSSRRG